MRPGLIFLLSVTAYGQVTAVSVEPSLGSGSTANFSFTFSSQNGYQDLSVVNILINDALDGRKACYLALAANTLNLVDDQGDAAGPYANAPMQPGLASQIQNSQCAVNGGSVTVNGNTLLLRLSITFAPNFAGNKLIYLAARSATANTGWQALGTWTVTASSTPPPPPLILTPARSGGFDHTLVFTLSNVPPSNRVAAVFDVLINSALDGRHACYLGFVPIASGGYLQLVDDQGDSTGGFQTAMIPAPPGTTIFNSQCTIDASASSAALNGNVLTLTLAITFNPAFSGNQLIYAASLTDPVNSGWQAVGTTSVGADSQAPTVTSVTPTSSPSGSPDFTLTVSGSNFSVPAPCALVCGFACPGPSVLNFAHVDLITQRTGNGQLQATIPASLLTNARTVDVTVRNQVNIECLGQESHVSTPQTFAINP
jgi:hypothetical protein